MRNRAKCKKCEDVIESFHRHDFVSCKCGEISVDGGQEYFRCLAKDWANFIRVDDENNEIPVKIVAEEQKKPLQTLQTEEPQSLTLETRLSMLDEMIKSIERLPDYALDAPVNHYDYLAMLTLLREIFKSLS